MRRPYYLSLVAVSTGALFAFSVQNSSASSFVINEQSASGLGTAYAGGAAQAEDPSALFFNPASIALLDYGAIQGDVTGLFLNGQFSNSGSRYNLPGTPFNGLRLNGGDGGNFPADKVLPNFYLSQPIFRNTPYGDLTFGIGVTTPYGLETDYAPGWVGRYMALRTKLTTIDIQPTIAYRLFNRLSVGVSLDIQYASERVSNAIDFGELANAEALAPFYQTVGTQLAAELAAAGVPPAIIQQRVAQTVGTIEQAYARAGFVPQGRDGISEFNADGWDLGFSIGAIFEYLKPGQIPFLQDGRIGVSFRSAMLQNLRGSVQFSDVPGLTAPGAPLQFPDPGLFQDTFFNQNATSSLNLPEIYHFSIFQRLAERFAVMGDIAWTRWSELSAATLTFSNPAIPAQRSVFNYNDELRYSIGCEWYATKALTFRLGFSYDRTPVVSAQFNNPSIPDADRYLLAAGFRWSVTRNVDLDFGYMHIFENDATINYTDSFGHNLRGNATLWGNLVSAALTVKWGGPKEAPAPEEKSGKSAVGFGK
jgi:long-chain fatty acid transport protein